MKMSKVMARPSQPVGGAHDTCGQRKDGKTTGKEQEIGKHGFLP